MTQVFCDITDCKFNKYGECQNSTIRFDCSECLDYVDYTEGAPEYQETYYAACQRSFGNGTVHFRIKKKGRKYEWGGFTCYTSNDIRYGIEDAYFTEARTGILFPMEKLQNGEIQAETIKEKMEQYPDVMSLPLYEIGPDGNMHEVKTETEQNNGQAADAGETD